MTPQARRHGLLIGLGAAVIALLLWFSHATDGWENTTWNWRVRALARPGPQTSEIVLVLLDQKSLDWGQNDNGLSWPWPREPYALLLDFCTRAGVRAVAFDVIYSEPSVYGVWDDQALGEAIARNGRFIGARFIPVNKDKISEPIPEVSDNAKLLANVSDVPDRDGVFRYANLFRDINGQRTLSLGAGAWLTGDSTRISPSTPNILLRFRGPANVYTPLSAYAVIQSELQILEGAEPVVDPTLLKDKYVLFGFSAPGLYDLRPTPISQVTPGVFIHATALDNLLTGDFMRETPAAATAAGTLVITFLAGLVVVAITSVPLSLAIGFLLLLIPAALGFALYAGGWWWPVLPGTIGVLITIVGGLARNFAVEGSQRRFIKQAFRHYLSPDVIEKILVDPKALQLGGERRELTIMFSDLAGFTSLSEGMDPIDLTKLLNDYLSDMTDIILEEGGTLDKYEGDAILAFWNAPLSQPDHALRACRAAVRCQKALADRRPEFKTRSGRDMYMRMGLHTGVVVVGNMGSRQRFDYTVLGDAANLASRLEGANKVFGSGVMVSAETLHQTGEALLSRELGELTVVGRREPVHVHELLGLAGDDTSVQITAYQQALVLCRAGELQAAADAFSALSGDPIAETYLQRCRQALTAAEEFKGLWNLTSK